LPTKPSNQKPINIFPIFHLHVNIYSICLPSIFVVFIFYFVQVCAPCIFNLFMTTVSIVCMFIYTYVCVVCVLFYVNYIDSYIISPISGRMAARPTVRHMYEYARHKTLNKNNKRTASNCSEVKLACIVNV
jgi:hypothetical protein